MGCPTADQWLAFTKGSGTHSERASLVDHAAGCATCRDVLSTFAMAPTTVPQTVNTFAPEMARPQLALLAPGTAVGRYVIEGKLGIGGMGVVYAAHDPELNRKVAIKLLREGRSNEWLRREARALAKLDHPNVVAVYDVGEHEGSGFVAMALVEGRTLRDWRTSARSVRDVLRVLVDAGRGLAAAHAAGLIHRDFKPDNVFVSDRGRVIVGDFGLARAEAEGEEAGLIAGTPAYMAPEQVRGEPTVQSDQFALCVTAWEALYGTLPFAGSGLDIDHTAPVEPARDPGVPSRVRRALERGLRVDPAARWPSIEELLGELAGDRARRRRAIAIAALGAVLTVGGVWIVARSTASEPERCRSADVRLAEAWTPARAAEIRDVVARKAPYAGTSIGRAIAALDAYGASWKQSWQDTCRAEVSDAGFDLRIACLDQRLRAIANAADALGVTDLSNARSAFEVALTLPDLARCADVASLRKVAPPPAAIASQVNMLERDVAKGDALIRAGRHADADAILQRAQREADALGYGPLQARAALAVGSLLKAQSRWTDAKAQLDQALNLAIASSDDETTSATYVQLARTAVGLSDVARAREYASTADASLRRIGDPKALRASWLAIDATLPVMEGNYAEALTRVERTIATLEAKQQPRLASSLYRIHSALLGGLGRIEEARKAYTHEVDAVREMLGTAHPDYADARLARGDFLLTHDDFPGAIDDLTKGYETLVAALGPDHAQVINAGARLANIDMMFARYDAAIAKLQRVLEVAEAGGSKRDIASARRSIAEAQIGANRYAEGERELARVAEIDRTLQGPDSLSTELILAQLRLEQGRFAEARTLLDRVRPAVIKLLGADNPALADVWILEARLAHAANRSAESEAALAKVTSGIAVIHAEVILAEVLAKRGDKAGAAAARKAALERIDAISPDAFPEQRAQLAHLPQ
ncbi:MAG TPA: protein kinase [Kofleriaceae bacterium]